MMPPAQYVASPAQFIVQAQTQAPAPPGPRATEVVPKFPPARSGPAPQATTDVSKVAVASGEIDPRLFLLREPDSARAAAFRILRHRFIGSAARVAAVTSAMPREGKTTCAANLALALCEGGRAQVLLIEANLRAPALAQMFRFEPPRCFRQQLQGGRDQKRWIVADPGIGTLHVAAVSTADAPAPMDGGALDAAVRVFAYRYDYVIIDSPSVLGSADANVIQESVEGALIATVAHLTRASRVRNAVAQLQPAHILGFVLLQ